MNEQQQENLSNLRSAASLDQPQLCYNNLARLVPDISSSSAIELIVKYLRRFLVDLRGYYPEDANIAASIQAFNDITSFETLGKQAEVVYLLLESSARSPGINNYRYALKLLFRPHDWGYPPNHHPKTVLSVISNTLVAIPDLFWGTQNPELWRRWFRAETKEDFFILVRYYATDPNVIELHKSLWMEVADDIEAALQAE